MKISGQVAIVTGGASGLGAATAVLVSSAYGAREREGVVRAGLIGFGVTALFGVVVSLIVWPAAPWIAAAYTTEPQVIAVAAGAGRCAARFPDAPSWLLTPSVNIGKKNSSGCGPLPAAGRWTFRFVGESSLTRRGTFRPQLFVNRFVLLRLVDSCRLAKN